VSHRAAGHSPTQPSAVTPPTGSSSPVPEPTGFGQSSIISPTVRGGLATSPEPPPGSPHRPRGTTQVLHMQAACTP
jgi:hypothetical protein